MVGRRGAETICGKRTNRQTLCRCILKYMHIDKTMSFAEKIGLKINNAPLNFPAGKEQSMLKDTLLLLLTCELTTYIILLVANH